jgi:anaerobic magnesium-protoporphyrin IX monomethyl ester cyclase
MKYHFVYPDIGTGYFPSVHHGLAQLISILKEKNHEVSLQHITKTPKPQDILSIIEREKPDLIGFTAMSNQMEFVKLWSGWIKEKYNIPIVCGGVHATLNPEEVLSIKSVDMVCVGEGDISVPNRDFWYKRFGSIQKTIPYNLVANLDTLPFPDYELFDVQKMLKVSGGVFPVSCSRGCLFDCSYCVNHALREKYKGLGTYFRFRSVDNTISMLSHYLWKYSLNHFTFADDIFGVNKEWVYEFCEKYPKHFNRTFDCNLRVEMVTEDLLKALKSAGCTKVELGIESGNEWMRKEVLNRNMTNEQILNAFDMAHKLGLKTRSYNMIGLPFELGANIQETINLNKQAKPDEVAVFYFYPYKGTKLYDVCKEKGFLTDRKTTSYTSESVLFLMTISQKELKKLYNEFMRFAISRRVKFPLNIIAYILRLVTFGNEVNVIQRGYQWLKS